jgi:hypothetical protein
MILSKIEAASVGGVVTIPTTAPGIRRISPVPAPIINERSELYS